jgi:predicted GNAT family acetyltransferase
MGTDTHLNADTGGQVLQVIHHVRDRFYELLVDGQFAGLVVYEDAGSQYVFTHTFIAEGYRGRGLSYVLLQGALEDIKERQITVTNYRPVLDRFISINPGYAPLIDSGKPGNWPKVDSAAEVSSTAAARM